MSDSLFPNQSRQPMPGRRSDFILAPSARHGCAWSFGESADFVKTRLAIWLGVELFVASGVSSAACILRRDEVRAWKVWHDTPTSATRAELDRQHRITFRHHVVFAVVLWAGMAVVTVPIVVAVFRRTTLRPESATAFCAEP